MKKGDELKLVTKISQGFSFVTPHWKGTVMSLVLSIPRITLTNTSSSLLNCQYSIVIPKS